MELVNWGDFPKYARPSVVSPFDRLRVRLSAHYCFDHLAWLAVGAAQGVVVHTGGQQGGIGEVQGDHLAGGLGN